MTFKRTLALASLALVFSTSALAASPNSSITGKDASAANVTLGAVSDGTLKSPSHSLVDSTGAVVDPANAANQTSTNTKLDTLHTDNGSLATSALQTTGNTSLGTIATNSGTQATAANQTSVIGSKAPGTAAASSLLAGGVYTSAGVTLTNGQQSAFQFDNAGNLKINVTAGGAGGGAVTAASGAYAAGAFAAGAGVDGWDLTEGAKGDTAYAGSGSASVVAILKGLYAASIGSIPAGTAVIGHVIADSGSTTAVTALPALAAGANLIGKVGVDQTTPGTTNAVQTIAGTTGGATQYGLQSAATTNSTSVKASAGVLYGLNPLNTTTTLYYLRMYDSATAPTCSSATNFIRTWPVPPAAAAGGAGGVAVKLPEAGVQFSNGIAFCLTGGPTSTDNTSAATGVFINLDYK